MNPDRPPRFRIDRQRDLLQAMGKKVVVPRREIKRLESSGLSLMPEGLEAGVTPAELRDVIAFIQEGR